MKKTIIRILVLILILVPITLLLLHKKPEEKRREKSGGKRKIEALVVRPTKLLLEISVTGSLLSYDEVELKNEVPGRIVLLNLPEGKAVSKGTVLVKLFNDDLQAGLRKLKAQLDLQQQIYKRQSELIKVNGISQNEFELSLLQVNTLQAEVEAQKALIRKTEILAPFDGIIGLRNVSSGAVVNTSTTLATIRSNRLKLDFFVPEKYGEAIKSGMNVDFSLYSGQSYYHASVLATERSIDDATRNLKVRAVVNQKAADLIPGAFANVKLQLGTNPNALLIPTEAIIPTEREKQVIVARKGKAHFVTVTTGIRKESMVEVTKGLQPGDTLVVSGLLFFKEGDVINYSNVTDTK
ncbi:MAG TPA: efflux RND transporter periplasmic adaptor subunit [Bacteroidales bacterium]|nr:efflux RND transporter periplasmic adaptor subunit [Bacteroidales bacterium]